MSQESFWVIVATSAVVALVFVAGAFYKSRKTKGGGLDKKNGPDYRD